MEVRHQVAFVTAGMGGFAIGWKAQWGVDVPGFSAAFPASPTTTRATRRTAQCRIRECVRMDGSGGMNAFQ